MTLSVSLSLRVTPMLPPLSHTILSQHDCRDADGGTGATLREMKPCTTHSMDYRMTKASNLPVVRQERTRGCDGKVEISTKASFSGLSSISSCYKLVLGRDFYLDVCLGYFPIDRSVRLVCSVRPVRCSHHHRPYHLTTEWAQKHDAPVDLALSSCASSCGASVLVHLSPSSSTAGKVDACMAITRCLQARLCRCNKDLLR